MRLDARRLEELSLNSSAPPAQLLYDGWLLRLQPGKAKRARSVNAVYPSTLPVDEKVGYCERLYAAASLPAIFRITPFTQPATLDAELERRGYGTFDFTAVECATIDPGRIGGGAGEPMPFEPWVQAVAELRGSSPEQRDGHRARVQACPLEKRAVGITENGQVVATGLSIVEDGTVGLFDIVTHPEHRRRGLGRRITAGLLAHAFESGIRDAYLQVDRDNLPARKLYAQLGFAERYLYWYRGREGERR